MKKYSNIYKDVTTSDTGNTGIVQGDAMLNMEGRTPEKEIKEESKHSSSNSSEHLEKLLAANHKFSDNISKHFKRNTAKLIACGVADDRISSDYEYDSVEKYADDSISSEDFYAEAEPLPRKGGLKKSVSVKIEPFRNEYEVAPFTSRVDETPL